VEFSGLLLADRPPSVHQNRVFYFYFFHFSPLVPKYSKNIFYILKYLEKSIRVEAGVDVMIAIFCDFCQFSAKKLAFTQKPM
jgi:hypothetical protein